MSKLIFKSKLFNFTIVGILCLCALIMFSHSADARSKKTTNFVSVKQSRFFLNGKPYFFMGTNFWAGANLGSLGISGDRPRLLRELDRLKALKITNLRILALSEGADSDPWQIVPAVQPKPGEFREELLIGLDFLLSEMKKREMTAVVVLNNFWPWSGGMAQYLKWATGEAIPYPPPQPGGDWGKYEAFTAKFYSNKKAVRLFEKALEKIISRKNTINGEFYVNDPTILSWELANEPRGTKNEKAFGNWIRQTAKLIKKWDLNHLVTPGIEGYAALPGSETSGGADYSQIDYLTIHIWAQNVGWYDPKNPSETFKPSIEKMVDYFQKKTLEAEKMKKPLVLEEFGLARDFEACDSKSPTTYRDRYYEEVFSQVLQAATAGKPMMGVNFWAWAGEARPRSAGGLWRIGDSFLGDPPHEPQGWYSVFDTDGTTLALVRKYADALLKLSTD